MNVLYRLYNRDLENNKVHCNIFKLQNNFLKISGEVFFLQNIRLVGNLPNKLQIGYCYSFLFIRVSFVNEDK